MDLRSTLKAFISKELAEPGTDVETESLVESGVIDSVGIMKLVDFIESEVKVKIGDEDLVPENFDTLDDIIKLVESKAG